jgi:hypothetical protein
MILSFRIQDYFMNKELINSELFIPNPKSPAKATL